MSPWTTCEKLPSCELHVHFTLLNLTGAFPKLEQVSHVQRSISSWCTDIITICELWDARAQENCENRRHGPLGTGQSYFNTALFYRIDVYFFLDVHEEGYSNKKQHLCLSEASLKPWSRDFTFFCLDIWLF